MHNPAKKTLLFLILTFTVNWSLDGVYYAFGGRLNHPSALAVLPIYMFIPMFVAFFLQRFIHHEPLRAIGVSFQFNRWFFFAWLLPPVLAFCALGVSLLMPGVSYSPDLSGFFERFQSLLTPEQLQQMKEQIGALPIHPLWLGLLQGLLAGATINAVAGFGEELGWRGYLQNSLKSLGFWRSSYIIGAIWGLWHAPIIVQGYNYPEHPIVGVFMMIAVCTLLGPIFSYIRIKSGSVLAAAIAHGSFNGTVGLSTMVLRGGDDLTVGMMGLSGLVVLGLWNIALFFADRTVTPNGETSKHGGQ